MKTHYGERFVVGIICAIAVLGPRAAAALAGSVLAGL